MPITLTKPADDVDIESAEYVPLLDNLQANILWPHGRNFARHVFVRFTGTPDAVKAWIRATGKTVTRAGDQLAQIKEREKDEKFDGGVVKSFFISARGYEFLGFDTRRFEHVFRSGMKSQKPNLVDAITGTRNKDPKPAAWEAGFQKEIHALVTVADSREDVANKAADAVKASLAGVGEVLTVECGTVLRRDLPDGSGFEPVEHFGYFDGISNPIFTRRDLDKEAADRPENFPWKEWDPGAPLSMVLTGDPLTSEADAYGSYLVYRKLGQDFALFESRVKALAAAMGIDPELAGALVVGRFKDGTPVLSANLPSPGLEVLNDFNYDKDGEGVRCPFQSHIRKVNPRGTAPGKLEKERLRRITRRGIPYGEPMPGVAKGAKENADPKTPRGLLFMCFQQDIDDQWEFIQRTWADNVIFPKGLLLQKDTGDDPLIGQDPDEAQRWPKAWGDDQAGKKAFNFESAVTLKGGEYFFAPSIPFLESI